MERVKTFFDQFDGQRVRSKTTQKSSVNFEFEDSSLFMRTEDKERIQLYRNGGRIQFMEELFE